VRQRNMEASMAVPCEMPQLAKEDPCRLLLSLFGPLTLVTNGDLQQGLEPAHTNVTGAR